MNFIHIPKNAGSMINSLLKSKQYPKIIYRGHDFDVKGLPHNSLELIVIRDPIDRFCSAVRYAIEKYSHTPNIKSLIDLQIIEPEQFAQIWKDPNHPYHSILMKEILNDCHHVGSKKLTYKYTYSSQMEWIHKPTHIILFENFEEEFPLIMKQFGYHNIKLGKVNSSSNSKQKYELSKSSIDFLQIIYEDDIKYYQKWKDEPFEKRINLMS